jgi:hypothetical protein
MIDALRASVVYWLISLSSEPLLVSVGEPATVQLLVFGLALELALAAVGVDRGRRPETKYVPQSFKFKDPFH